MVKARVSTRDVSGSTELPFEPMVFPATVGSIPLGQPDTASLTAMPEARAPMVIPTDTDWREHPRWKPLVGTPSRTPIPSGTLVPDPSPARSCSDAASDVLMPPSPAGSFVHRRRRGEYAQRPPVWSIQALVEDTKGCHEFGKPDYDYAYPWSGRVVSSKISYASQMEKMAGVLIQEPLIVRMAIDTTSADTSAAANDAVLSKITTPGGTVEDPPFTGRVLSKPVPPSSSQLIVHRVRQDQPSNTVGDGTPNPSAATFINQIVQPWLKNIPPTPNGREQQNSFRRDLLRSYTDVRSEANIQIMPGSLVVCVGATSTFTAAEDHSDQFRMVFGGLYRVLQVFGDTWAFCRKLSGLSSNDMVESSFMPDSSDMQWARQKLLGSKKEICFALIEPTSTLNFLPLCAVTLLENFEEYCLRARIGPGFSQQRTSSGVTDAAVAAPSAARSQAFRAASEVQPNWEHKPPHEGGLVKAAPRFSSIEATFNSYRKPEGVLVPLAIYREYLRPLMAKKPTRVWKDREAVIAAFDEPEEVERPPPTPTAPVIAPQPIVSTASSRFGTVSLRSVAPADSASVHHRDPAPAPRAVRPIRASGGISPPQHVECTAATPPRSGEPDSMSGDTVRNPRFGTWSKIKFATQRFGTQGRQKVRDYFAAPEWVRKSPYQVRSMF